MLIEKLDWDSNFFGFKIGKIVIINEKEFNWNAFKNEANTEKYQLIYILKPGGFISGNLMLKAKFELMDIQITMIRPFDRSLYINCHDDFKTKLSDKELIECHKIAEGTATVSRFYHEKLIGPQKTMDLYRKWIDNALNKTFSDGLFITKENDVVIGLHVIRTDNINKIGYFTLTGVDSDYKRMGKGRELWEKSYCYWANKSEIDVVKSPFSIKNIESFNFHLKMGFNKIDEMKFIYHYRTN